MGRLRTCADLVGALDDAGLASLVPEALAGNGLVPGGPEDIAARAEPCEGATPLQHAHVFDADGRFTSRDGNGDEVDNGTYTVRGNTVSLATDAG